MKKSFLSIVTLVFVSIFGVAHGETVRILSTNDMHSAIEKMPQLAAIVDSLRAIDPFMLIISAGETAPVILTTTFTSPFPIPW